MQYSKVIFPVAVSGFVFGPAVGAAISYNGVAPSTASSAGAIVSPTWNPTSANAVDRTQYWPDTAGLMSYSEVQIDMIGLPAMAAAQLNSQIPAFQAAVEVSVPVTISGAVYNIDLGKTQQPLNLLHGSLANSFKQSAVPHALGAVVAPGTVIFVNGEYYITPNGGTTAATAPNFPANSLTSTPSVNDNSVTWNVVQFATNLVSGAAILLSIAELTAVFVATYNQVNIKRATLDTVAAALNVVGAAPTVWVPGTTIVGGSGLVLNGNLFTADAAGGVTGGTIPVFNTGVSSTTIDNTVTWTCLGDVMTYIGSHVFH